jgi:hypothetical protein
MSAKLRSLLLLLLIGMLLVGAGFVQQSLNRDRDRLGLTRVQPLENAPPVLAFTTVALGGFRGLISNALWMRASDLQEEDKFFEMAQLADWITKLEPHFVHVWLVQAWNMAYNISVKFKESAPGQFPDRWRWVKAGIELLRDQGLEYNKNETLIYRELAWLFQHKIGQNLDDASVYYKQQWANDMAKVFDKKTPNLEELIHPQTADQKERARLLRETYKMDPQFMKEVDERYGPLEWRLPEAHAIYWAAMGLKKAAENPTKVKEDDLITLRRVIYQSMLLSFQRGRLVTNPFAKSFEFGPNLDIIPKVSYAYEQAAREDAKNHDHILKAHRNFLRDAVYFLYVYNRLPDAAQWFKYLATNYPDKTLLDNNTNSFPANLTLDKYAVARVQGDISESGGRDRTEGVMEGLLVNSYRSMVLAEDAAAAGFKLLARQVWIAYQREIPEVRMAAIGLRPFEEIDQEVRRRMLDSETGEPPEVRALLRAKLGQPPEPSTSPATTNAPPQKASSQ